MLSAQLHAVPATPVPVVLATGSNLGDSRQLLAEALAGVEGHPQITVTAVSPLARTAPVGGVVQPDFLNQVILVDTTLSAAGLLAYCHDLEQAAARVRDIRWGPRTLDVDIITYDDVHSDHPDLTLPHPRAHERAFVLAPWSWADPHAILADTPVAQLAAAADDAATVHRLEEPA